MRTSDIWLRAGKIGLSTVLSLRCLLAVSPGRKREFPPTTPIVIRHHKETYTADWGVWSSVFS